MGKGESLKVTTDLSEQEWTRQKVGVCLV